MTFLSGQVPTCGSAMIYLTEKKGKLAIYLQESTMQIWSLTRGRDIYFTFLAPPHSKDDLKTGLIFFFFLLISDQ